MRSSKEQPWHACPDEWHCSRLSPPPSSLAAAPHAQPAGLPLRRQGRQGRLLRPLAAHRLEGRPGEAPARQLHRDQRPSSLATSRRRSAFPVTLYTFACGAVCQNAEGLLNRRGVPFTTVNVEDAKGAEQLEEADRRAAGAGAAGRRQAHRQGLQRGALDRRCSTRPAIRSRRRAACAKPRPPEARTRGAATGAAAPEAVPLPGAVTRS